MPSPQPKKNLPHEMKQEKTESVWTRVGGLTVERAIAGLVL